MQKRKIHNIGFVSTRIAGTDGVSLEIEKWAAVLERKGFNCFYFAGEIDRGNERSLKVPDAHFEAPRIQEIQEQLFGVTKRSRDISDHIQSLKDGLKSSLYDFCENFDIDLIIPENALTVPMNIPLGIAITEFIAETGIPTIAHHHDFYWERDRFLINACQDYLDKGFPPDLPSIRHVVINSLASKQLSHRSGISNTIIPNVYNFAKKPLASKVSSCEIKKEIGLGDDELMILQPTRVVPRKWIERSIEIVQHLNIPNPTLVISHTAGDEGCDYYRRIMEYAENAGVRIISIDHLIGSHSVEHGKAYTIADIYQCADLVTYPSGYEGFGNAFLETIYYKKPIVVNRYSIYIADIEPKGFDVIKIDGFATSSAIEKISCVLGDTEELKKMVDRNYELGEKFFSFEILEKRLLHLIGTFD